MLRFLQEDICCTHCTLQICATSRAFCCTASGIFGNSFGCITRPHTIIAIPAMNSVVTSQFVCNNTLPIFWSQVAFTDFELNLKSNRPPVPDLWCRRSHASMHSPQLTQLS